jgi:hypothetical protein
LSNIPRKFQGQQRTTHHPHPQHHQYEDLHPPCPSSSATMRREAHARGGAEGSNYKDGMGWSFRRVDTYYVQGNNFREWMTLPLWVSGMKTGRIDAGTRCNTYLYVLMLLLSARIFIDPGYEVTGCMQVIRKQPPFQSICSCWRYVVFVESIASYWCRVRHPMLDTY